jgi:hypothetical protein
MRIRIRDPGIFLTLDPGSRMEKIRIRDKQTSRIRNTATNTKHRKERFEPKFSEKDGDMMITHLEHGGDRLEDRGRQRQVE